MLKYRVQNGVYVHVYHSMRVLKFNDDDANAGILSPYRSLSTVYMLIVIDFTGMHKRLAPLPLMSK